MAGNADLHAQTVSFASAPGEFSTLLSWSRWNSPCRWLPETVYVQEDGFKDLQSYMALWTKDVKVLVKSLDFVEHFALTVGLVLRDIHAVQFAVNDPDDVDTTPVYCEGGALNIQYEGTLNKLLGLVASFIDQLPTGMHTAVFIFVNDQGIATAGPAGTIANVGPALNETGSSSEPQPLVNNTVGTTQAGNTTHTTRNAAEVSTNPPNGRSGDSVPIDPRLRAITSDSAPQVKPSKSGRKKPSPPEVNKSKPDKPKPRQPVHPDSRPKTKSTSKPSTATALIGDPRTNPVFDTVPSPLLKALSDDQIRAVLKTIDPRYIL